MTTGPTYLVTGGMGCLGAWTLHHLVREGKRAISFDLSEDRHRLNLLLTPEEQGAITFLKGDLTDFGQVHEALEGYGVTHVVHLAALQIPFCKADPVLGARVNVGGTVNIFEAARLAGLEHIAYASSVAVYGPPSVYRPGVIAADSPFDPRTLYGVYKQANEGTARIYWQDHKVSSTTLRPYTVYGIGRDQGVTSEPTKAMLAAAAGRDYQISFGGTMQFQLAPDVAKQFVEAAETPLSGAYGFALGTTPTAVAEVAALIERERPGVSVTCDETPLPFPQGIDSGEFKTRLPRVVETPLADGIRQTIEHFETLLAKGYLNPEPQTA